MASGIDCYSAGGDLLQCAIQDIVGPFGEGLFALIVAGCVFVGLWYAGDGRLETPAVVLIILGGWIVPSLPGNYQQMAQTLAILGLTAAVLSVLNRYVMSEGI